MPKPQQSSSSGNGILPPRQRRSYNPDYFGPLALSEERHFWFRSRNRLITFFLKKYKKVVSNQPYFLEIGCGTGNVLRALSAFIPEGDAIGMDLFHDGLAYARNRVNYPLVQADLHSPPFSTKFGMIGLFDVLEHIEEDTQVLESIYRMLVTDGRLILTVPAFSSLWSNFDVAGHHVRRYHKKDLIEKLEMAGFKVIHSSYFMSLLFPLVWIRRRLVTGNKFNSVDDEQIYKTSVEELQVIPVINDVINFALGLENWLISRGVQFPFGTSLIVLAGK